MSFEEREWLEEDFYKNLLPKVPVHTLQLSELSISQPWIENSEYDDPSSQS